MAKLRKRLSNPSSSGGLGIIFETRVQASFVTLMLSGGFAPCLPPWPITKIKLQGKYEGYDTDDLIVFIKSPDGREGKMLCQIKHSININPSDKVFAEVIQNSWNDFNDGRLFAKGKDLIALITGPLSDTDINDVRWILECAQTSDDAKDFLKKVNQTNFSSKQKIKKLNVFRTHLKNANNGTELSDEQFWQFMKVFHLLGYDLDFPKLGVTLSLLQSLIGQYSSENAHALWTQIVDEVQSKNKIAGTITVESIPEELYSAFQKPGEKVIPSDLGIKPSIPAIATLNIENLAIAILLGGWDENA